MQTNYGVVAKPGSAAALAGSAHLFLMQLDRWCTETGAGQAWAGSDAETACDRLRAELTDWPGAAAMPGKRGIGSRLRAGWKGFRNG